MKNILSLLLLCALSAAIAGPSKSWILGHWRYAEENHSADETFCADGTFTGNVAIGGTVVWRYSGTWSIVGDMLNYQYTQSSLQQIPVGKTGGDKLIEISKDHFVLQTANQEQHTYRLVQ